MNDDNYVSPLIERVRAAQIPEELSESIILRLDQLYRLKESPNFLPELDRVTKYVDWVVALPWNKKTEDVIDLTEAKKMLDENHYGLTELKDRILEYLAVMKLKSEQEKGEVRAPILCFVGLVGTGKTTFAYSVADALGRKIARIPFGGMGDPLDLRGQSRMHPEAEPGKIIKALRAVGSRNPVILLDEIDRVTDEGRASIMGVLVELLDPQQNQAFVDHYIDFPFNLSEAIFIATANNTTNISTAVMDRIEPISMPSYSDEEKVVIARDFLLPRALEEAGMKPESLKIESDVWINMVRPLGFDAGIRTLERTLKGTVRKVARMIVEGKGESFTINSGNVKQFLPQW